MYGFLFKGSILNDTARALLISVKLMLCVSLVTGALPPDSDIYYGFTRFAIELNETDREQVHLYPPTDTRFRPDQRSDSFFLRRFERHV